VEEDVGNGKIYGDEIMPRSPFLVKRLSTCLHLYLTLDYCIWQTQYCVVSNNLYYVKSSASCGKTAMLNEYNIVKEEL
jgi:hypothetical protein